MIKQKNTQYHNVPSIQENENVGIIERVAKERKELQEKNRITLEDLKRVIHEVKEAERIILRALIDIPEEQVKGDSHILESNLTQKNKYILREILPSICVLYIYENEGNNNAIERGIDILSPDNKNTDNYLLSIKIERKHSNSPFFIKKIELLRNKSEHK